jgi:glycosyltransferase involved in cell wall biosynthesis
MRGRARETRVPIVHVAPTAFGGEGLYGGGERYPLELCRAVARHVPCRLVTFAAQPRVERLEGLELVVLRRVAAARGHPAHPLGPGLRRALEGSSVVHVHQARSVASRAAAVFARAARRTAAVTDHGLGRGRWLGAPASLYSLFLTVSEYSATTLKAPRSKTRIIYGGADVQLFSPRGNEEREGVLFVGRITPHKGLDVLIRALPEDACLTVAGTTGHDPKPPQRDYPALIRRLAKGKNVRFAGAVSDRELARLYRTARVVVLPSVHRTCYGNEVAISELLGLSLIEAMASGTPVICSNVGGLPEVVAHGTTGYVVEPGNGEALSESISRLLSDRALVQAMGRNARDLVMQRFTWDACAARCLMAYESLDTAG